jgi:hypothetical protein
MIFSSVNVLRFILGPPWVRIIGKSHIQHGSYYGGTIKNRKHAIMIGAPVRDSIGDRGLYPFKVRMYGCNLFLFAIIDWKLGKQGRLCMRWVLETIYRIIFTGKYVGRDRT